MALADALTDLSAGDDHFRFSERPHKSAHANTYNDATSGNNIQPVVFHNPSTRN
jgi:hypothetical protein